MRAEISLVPFYVRSPHVIKAGNSEQHKGHEVYTGSGHHCGVIPYSSVVWWIASWAEDEQLQGKNSLLRRGVLVLDELVWSGMICDEMSQSLPMVVASATYRGPGPLPKY